MFVYSPNVRSDSAVPSLDEATQAMLQVSSMHSPTLRATPVERERQSRSTIHGENVAVSVPGPRGLGLPKAYPSSRAR